MKRIVLVGIIAALLAGILTIGLVWTKVTPVVPATPPDSASTPR
ncbi:hypothetical protein [Methylobacterium aerolatum]|uniref:Flp pilus assembly protein CpaB n=1 Tax=Methylobacterium aerolatum TaxID=418708 RepID=A0ABU0I431_9HYPH|nr:hypothetical protein [Methylobacterium aerolatum]MDQ0449373.1 hypothetical protein [Methylobacterium aerolatum]GJD36678.1 hypothetical protein FMGBMHLM_3601 [Methylobacterium aerolatum]